VEVFDPASTRDVFIEALFDQSVKDSIQVDERERERERNGHETAEICIIRSFIIRTVC
jgi:hypothetical protein